MNDVHVRAGFSRQVVDFLSRDSLVQPLNHSVSYHVQVQVLGFQLETQSFQTLFNRVYFDSLLATVSFRAKFCFGVLFYLFSVFKGTRVK
jgi:hypothetical protein